MNQYQFKFLNAMADAVEKAMTKVLNREREPKKKKVLIFIATDEGLQVVQRCPRTPAQNDQEEWQITQVIAAVIRMLQMRAGATGEPISDIVERVMNRANEIADETGAVWIEE